MEDAGTAGGMADRLTQLATVTAELAVADDVGDVSDIITRHTATALGATVSLLSLTSDSPGATRLGTHGASPATARQWAGFSTEGAGPVSDTARAGRALVLLGGAAVAARYPELVGDGDRSVVCLPLPGSDRRTIGVIGLLLEGRERRPDAQELQLLGVVAHTCAQALVRIEAQRDSAARATKLEFLANASQVLASSLDYRTTLSRVATLAVPTLADWCAVEMIEDGQLRTLAVAHVDPAKVGLAQALQERYPPDPSVPAGAPHVARTGVSELFEEITDEMLVASARDAEHLQIARDLMLRSAIVVPLSARGRVLGTITFIAAESGHRYTQEDVTFAEDLANRAALAIDNSDLHSQTRHAAVELQRAMLPQRLPEAEGWHAAAVYRQAGRTEVGGDFYDVLVLDGGLLAVFIGDVMGRGVDAASAAAQLRTTLRAYAVQDPAPAAVAAALDRLMSQTPLTPMATVAYLLFDTDEDCVDAVIAGHLPPLLLSHDGASRFLGGATSPPFGVGPFPRRAARAPFCKGDTMLLYTDGLVERRDEDIETGLARLRRDAALTRGDLTTRLGALADRVHDADRDDDIAALALLRTS